MSSTHRLLVRAIPIDMPRRKVRERFDPRRAPLRRRARTSGPSARPPARNLAKWIGFVAVLAALLFAGVSCVDLRAPEADEHAGAPVRARPLQPSSVNDAGDTGDAVADERGERGERDACSSLAFALTRRGHGPENEDLNGWWQP